MKENEQIKSSTGNAGGCSRGAKIITAILILVLLVVGGIVAGVVLSGNSAPAVAGAAGAEKTVDGKKLVGVKIDGALLTGLNY